MKFETGETPGSTEHVDFDGVMMFLSMSAPVENFQSSIRLRNIETCNRKNVLGNFLFAQKVTATKI